MQIREINKSEAFRYLGYGQSEPDEATLSIACQCEEQLLREIQIKYTYKYFNILSFQEGEDENYVELEGVNLKLEGSSITEHLRGCRGVIMMAVTLSSGVDRLIGKLSVSSMAKAVVADSMANAAIEQACDMVEEELIKNFEGKKFTFRFSPGYGDLSLGIQDEFLRVLDAGKRIGVNMTNSGLMTPCKSVTAIIGVSDNEVATKKRGCVVCNMKDTCAFRKRGSHCGF